MPPFEKGERQLKVRISSQSSSNSLPQSGAAQPILIFDASGSASTRGERTTQLPHFGQVTHQHAKRSAIKNYTRSMKSRRGSRRPPIFPYREHPDLDTLLPSEVCHDDGFSLRHQKRTATLDWSSD